MSTTENALSVHLVLKEEKADDKFLKKLKEEQRRKMALLGEQYEQTIAEMLQKQSVSNTFNAYVTRKVAAVQTLFIILDSP